MGGEERGIEGVYLLDTNILLELLLDQERADEAERLLRSLSSAYLSDFALFSVGIILLNRGRSDLFLQACEDLFLRGGCALLRLEVSDMPAVIKAIRQFKLDFDDAYQYTAAEKFNLTIVSFDSDFDRTERGRKTPADVLKGKETP